MNSGTVVEIPFLIKAIIIWYMVILEVLLIFLGIQKRESITLYTIIHISSFLLYVSGSLSYYIINPCVSASANLDDCFSFFRSPYNTVYDNILVTRILVDGR